MPTPKNNRPGQREVSLTNAEKHVLLWGDLAMRRLRAAQKAAKRLIPKKDDS